MTSPLVPQQTPRPYDRARGKDAAAGVAGLTAETRALLEGTAGCSPFLAGLIEKEADWLGDMLARPDDMLAEELTAAAAWQASDLADRLRKAKGRIALLSALADLGGVWPLARVTATLSEFAEISCISALRAAILAQVRRGKLPGVSEDDIPTGGGMVVLGMGKLGAFELNYSSDIDLICLFDETRFDVSELQEVRAGFVRATRAMCTTLSEVTASGYVFRTDLRLRPDPAVTPVCMAMEAAERYYESLGRTWERAAYIKARPVAGDLLAGQRFLEALTPFVWRKHLDFAAIQDAHDMRLAIREHKGLGGEVSLFGHDMKLGRGGIREIEFFTQTRQLIAGGRDPDLRCRGTVDGLGRLSHKGWVSTAVADALTQHYVAHRTVEHRTQMMRDAQTHNLPQTDEGFARLAALMDREIVALQSEIAERLDAVHGLTEGFFSPTPAASPTMPTFDPQVLGRWYGYPALRSERSRTIFGRLQTELLRRLAEASKPEAALLAFDGFLSQLPAGVQLFSLLEANPPLLDLLVDIVSTSPALAQHLSRNAGVLDAVIGGAFFTDWPGQDGLEAALFSQISRAGDYEARLDAARRWMKEWHFRIGVYLLRGLISPAEAALQYTDLARAILSVLWPIVCEMFAEKHGVAPGRGALVLGMGSLGAGRLNATSDLDLIVIYDARGEEASEGRKPLQTRPYYARLTQSLVTALSAPTAEGKLYEVDMRLRPSGNQGPVATSLAAFKSYQQEQAWLWEHLALTRAHVITGPPELVAEVEAFRRDIIAGGYALSAVAQEVVKMRARIQAFKSPAGVWEVKIGAGRLQDIELLAQAGALLEGLAEADTITGLEAAKTVGLIDAVSCDRLAKAADCYAAVNMAVRLLSAGDLKSEDLAPASRGFLSRTLNLPDIESLEQILQTYFADCSALIDSALAAQTLKDAT
ncbi:MAG: glutamine-synthetase adenylyltransferase [Pseudomonadota bacterium]